MNFPTFFLAMMAIAKFGESAKVFEHSPDSSDQPVLFDSNSVITSGSYLPQSLHVSDVYNNVPIEKIELQLNATVLDALSTLDPSPEFKLFLSSSSLKLKKKQAHQVSLKDNRIKTKAALREKKEDITDYTTLDFESDDGKTHAHCTIYPDGTQVACLQYTYHGETNTTVVVINPGDDGLHTVLNIPQEKQLEINKDLYIDKPVLAEHDMAARRLSEEPANSQLDMPPRQLSNQQRLPGTRSIAVAFTDQAIAALGDIKNAKAQAALQVSLTNAVLKNSKIDLVLSLNEIITGIIDVGSSDDNLYYARGFTRKSDFLILITNGNNQAGYGSKGFLYQNKPSDVNTLKNQLISVVVLKGLIGKSFPHEFGHNIGGQHQKMFANSPARFPNAYAFADIDQSIGTILAYIGNPANRFPTYSSATGVYAGQKVGSANENNSDAMKICLAEIIQVLDGLPELTSKSPTQQKTSSPTVATYNPSVRPSSYPTAPTYKPTTKPTNMPTKYPSKAPTTPKPTKVQTSYPTQTPTTNKPTSYPTTFPTPPTFVPTNRPTKTPKKRGLEELEKEVVAVFSFVDYVLYPDLELNKLLHGKNIKVLAVIASSPENIIKFIQDAVDSLGEAGTYKLMESGVLKKIFGFTKLDVAKDAREKIEARFEFIKDLIPTKRTTDAYH